MKKTLILALVVMASASFNVAIAGKKDKKQAKNAPAPVSLKSSSDTLSYTTGMSMTNGLIPYLQKQLEVDTAYMADFIRGFNEMIAHSNDARQKAYAAGMQIAMQLEGPMLAGLEKELADSPDSLVRPLTYRGFTDALTGDTTVFKTVAQAENVFKNKREADRKAKEERLYGPNREAGKKFLAENAAKDGVVTLPSGLQYKVLTKGEGEVPQRTDKVLVNYEGRLIDGTVFDASAKHGDKPASFRADQVIKGWTEALTMMPVGSKWQLFIPQELAYGERNMGQIKPYSTLIFDVELVGIDKPAAEKAEPKAEEVKAQPKKAVKKAKK